jgi:hypothetical protein
VSLRRAHGDRGASAKGLPREDEKAQILLKWPPTHSALQEGCPLCGEALFGRVATATGGLCRKHDFQT